MHGHSAANIPYPHDPLHPLPDGNTIPVRLSMPTSYTEDPALAYIRALTGGENDESWINTLKRIGEASLGFKSEDLSSGIDNSRTFNDLLQVNRNMLNAMITSMQKTDQLVRAMENSNIIARNTAYLRA